KRTEASPWPGARPPPPAERAAGPRSRSSAPRAPRRTLRAGASTRGPQPTVECACSSTIPLLLGLALGRVLPGHVRFRRRRIGSWILLRRALSWSLRLGIRLSALVLVVVQAHQLVGQVEAGRREHQAGIRLLEHHRHPLALGERGDDRIHLREDGLQLRALLG